MVFKTGVLNTASRKALARMGAVEEGIFCRVYFSILDSEWPAVKTGLPDRLRRANALKPGGSDARVHRVSRRSGRAECKRFNPAG